VRIPAFGLIGVGGFGRVHFETLRRFESEGKLAFRAACDPGIRPGSEMERVLQSSGVRTYRDYREMLAHEPGLRAVTIGTPICLHEEMAADCLGLGLHVYLEKPPVPLIGQLERLISMDGGGRVSVGFHMMDFEWVQKVKKWALEGRLGEIREIQVAANWPRRGAYYRRAPWAGRMVFEGKPVFDGPATNALSHLIHLAMFFAGDFPGTCAVPLTIRGELYRVRPIKSYDLACIKGTLSGGISFRAGLSHSSRTRLPFRIEIKGTHGWCRVREDEGLVTSWGGFFRIDPESPHPLDHAYGSFLDFVTGRRPGPTTSLADTRGYVLATNAALLSSGGIHEIQSPWVRAVEEEGDFQYVLDGLDEALAGDGLFSEQGIPWSVKTSDAEVGTGAAWADLARDLVFQSGGIEVEEAGCGKE
jgi:predicted dehydrogenase